MPPEPRSANSIRRLWALCSRLPGGRRLFGLLLGRLVPYTGTIAPRVEELRDGYARVRMHDRRRIRNHLHSIHAIALVNLAEVATGLALVHALPDDARGILAGISMEYLKKARGTLIAEAECPIPESNERREYRSVAVLRDAAGEEVARCTARWLVGPTA